MKASRTLVYGAVSLALILLFLPGYSKIQELRDKIRDLEEKNKRLSKENVVLQQVLDRVQNDKVLQEKILRDKMGVVRKDEIPVKIVPEQKNQ
jgi:cell division protein FtsB